jgi:GT2 family glycosyltransferase
MSNRPPLSVVIVTWNSAPVIANCLTSLRQQLPDGAEIIVIDNASADDTVAVVRRVDPTATIIANATNRGLAAANNQGMVAAAGPRFLICNPDVVFAPGAVDALLSVMDRHPRAAWVVPRLVYEDGSLQTSVGDLPTLSEALLGRQVARTRSAGTDSGFWWDGWPHHEERSVGRAFECAYLIRRDAVDDVGLQDERYFLDWEGLDWTERFRRQHWEIWFSPDAEVLHLGGTSRLQVPFRSVYLQHKGMYLYFSDRSPRLARPLLALAFGARGLFKMGVTRLGVPLYSWAHRGRTKYDP